MGQPQFISISPEELDRFMHEHNVKDYLLIDVRQPGEYEEGHLPGAKLIPIMHLVADLYHLPQDRDLIFYCRNDGRSMAAATLALEENITRRKIYHLTGGIMSYNGKIQSDKPRLKIFQCSSNILDQLKIAMNMEKGALEFYAHLAQQLKHTPCGHTFTELSRAEHQHIESIFRVLSALSQTDFSFKACFEQLEGDILEGGRNRFKLQKNLTSAHPNDCTAAIEVALEIEYSAYDLYRNLAESLNDKRAQELFWDLAQAEKAHIRQLSLAVA